MNSSFPVRDARPDDVVWPALAWPPPHNVRLVGPTVELTPWAPSRDAGELFYALDDESVWRHVAGRPKDAADFEARLAAYRAEGRFIFTVRLVRAYRGLPAGAVVGATSFLDVSPRDSRLEIGGTTYTRAVWASRVNPECKSLLLAYAFEALHAGRVQLKTDVRNTRSQEAIARLGARYEGTLRRHQRRQDGTVRDSVLFSIVAEEWPAVREALARRLSQPDPPRPSPL